MAAGPYADSERIPNEGRGWRQTRDRDVYAVYGLDELVDMLAPHTSKNNRAHAKDRILDTLGQLNEDGLMHFKRVGREARMLPPVQWTPTSDKSQAEFN